MSKNQVLDEVYPDELKYIWEKKRNKEIQRYEDHRHTMMAVAAGFGGKTESGETLFSIYSKQLDKIINQLENGNEPVEEKEYTPEYIDRELDKLRVLQGMIRQNKQRKRR